ncbi:MAG: ABC transporter permease [Candidatus Pacebacteria bacterium]|nr:ABC transporter permease [Candidatus Paceibacterota bacterium]
MAEKETKARYKNALLGFSWMVINPVLQMLIIGIIFQFFVSFQTIDNYYLFLLIGLLVWNFFSSSLNQISPVFIQQRFLLQKASFSREILPLSIVLSNMFHIIVSLILLLIYVFIFNDFVFSFISLMLLFSSVIWLLIFTGGLGLLTSSLNVKYRDVSFLVQASLPLGFYLTPIIYDETMLPSGMRWLLFINPLSSIIANLKSVFLLTPVLSINYQILSIFVTALTLFLGIIVFTRNSKNFSDYV